MRGRGLKPPDSLLDDNPVLLVAPMRGRGLKHSRYYSQAERASVAPHAGAWIETPDPGTPPTQPGVAPHAGAWIEIRAGRSTLTAAG